LFVGVDVYGKDRMNLLWIEDFPLFLPKEDDSEGLLQPAEYYPSSDWLCGICKEANGQLT